MTARSTMTEIISTLRDLIGDTAGANQVFADDDLQDVLDKSRLDCRYVQLSPVDTIESGGTVSWLTWYGGQNWEEDVALYDGSYNSITAGSANYSIGKFDFEASQTRGVLATGYTYDLYAAAATMLDMWIAKVKLSVDFSADGADFSLSQRITNMSMLARQYKSKSKNGAGMTVVERTDVNT